MYRGRIALTSGITWRAVEDCLCKTSKRLCKCAETKEGRNTSSAKVRIKHVERFACTNARCHATGRHERTCCVKAPAVRSAHKEDANPFRQSANWLRLQDRKQCTLVTPDSGSLPARTSLRSACHRGADPTNGSRHNCSSLFTTESRRNARISGACSPTSGMLSSTERSRIMFT